MILLTRFCLYLVGPGTRHSSHDFTWVGETFDCLSYTLEMPFKDVANNPDPMVGWSPDRAKHLGASVLESILVCVPELR